MNNSFYGGHDGRPFIITNTYHTVAEMTNDFANGAKCTATRYGDYVLINCDNKNNPENGQIYRRGINFNSEETTVESWVLNEGVYKPTLIANHGAIYIGTIVGPSGSTPQFHLRGFNQIKDIGTENEYNDDLKTLIRSVDAEYNGDVSEDYPVYQRHVGNGEYTLTSADLLPGKTEKGTYNDAIEYKYICIRNSAGDLTYAFVGFAFPYLVTEFTATLQSPYYEGVLVTKEDDGAHPFYNQWNLNIPQGYPGMAVDNIRIDSYTNILNNITTNNGNILLNTGFKRNTITGEFLRGGDNKLISSGIFEIDGTEGKKDENGTILVYDLIDYTNKAIGERYTVFIKQIAYINSAIMESKPIIVNDKEVEAYTLSIDYSNNDLCQDIANLNLRTVVRVYADRDEQDQNALYADYNDGSTFKIISDVSSLNTIDTTTITTSQSNTDIDNQLVNGGICFVIGDNAIE